MLFACGERSRADSTPLIPCPSPAREREDRRRARPFHGGIPTVGVPVFARMFCLPLKQGDQGQGAKPTRGRRSWMACGIARIIDLSRG